MSTHVPGFQSFSVFWHHFELAKLATGSIRVKQPLLGYHGSLETDRLKLMPSLVSISPQNLFPIDCGIKNSLLQAVVNPAHIYNSCTTSSG